VHLVAARPLDFPISYARDPKTIGEHIRKVRLYRGLRQRDLASQLNVTEMTVGNWELGKEGPSIQHLEAIIAFLGYDPEPPSGGLPGRLLALRRRLGLTQEQLAKKLGLDEGSVSRWEAGARRPSQWMAGRLKVLLQAMEKGDIKLAEVRDPTLSFFDLTRWRRKPPTSVTIQPRTFGERLRERRLRLGLSMKELAQRAGTSRGTVFRVEANKLRPSAKLRRALAQVLLQLSEN
jgi:transcriptional regulator with XRE-family HTH domain